MKKSPAEVPFFTVQKFRGNGVLKQTLGKTFKGTLTMNSYYSAHGKYAAAPKPFFAASGSFGLNDRQG